MHEFEWRWNLTNSLYTHQHNARGKLKDLHGWIDKVVGLSAFRRQRFSITFAKGRETKENAITWLNNSSISSHWMPTCIIRAMGWVYGPSAVDLWNINDRHPGRWFLPASWCKLDRWHCNQLHFERKTNEKRISCAQSDWETAKQRQISIVFTMNRFNSFQMKTCTKRTKTNSTAKSLKSEINGNLPSSVWTRKKFYLETPKMRQL